MVDVFFMRPNHPESRRMKSRLSVREGLSLQFVELAEDIGKLNPRPGSIFIFHISSLNELADLVAHIRALTKKSEATTLSIVISDVKGLQVRNSVEVLPQTIYYGGDRAVHDLDLLILKLMKQQALVTAPRRTETLTYTHQPERFISKDRVSKTFVTSEVQIDEARAVATNVFQPITDHIQKDLLMSDAVDSQAAVTVSNFGAKDEVKGYLFDLNKKPNFVFCQVKGTAAAVAAFKKQSEISKKMAISISLRQSRVFFVCLNFTWVKETTLEVAVPSLIYSVQRRRDFRLLCFPNGHQRLTIQTADFKGSYDVYDLSVGGVSALVVESNAAYLEAIAANAALVEIDGETVEVGPLKFRQRTAFKDMGVGTIVKMGFSFEKMKPAAKSKIGNYVDRQGRAYFMDYMVESEKAAAKK